MKVKFLPILCVVVFNFSCENRIAVDSQIETIITEYSQKYALKKPNISEEFSSKQSYEIGFFKGNEIDTIFYIVKKEAYGLKQVGAVWNSSFSRRLNLADTIILNYPFYMGSFFYAKDSIPIHVYDVFEKYGKSNYKFNNLYSLDFKDYIIKEEHNNIYTPNLWIYKIKNNKFIKIAETDTISYDI